MNTPTSTDQQNLAHWRFPENYGFVCKDYTGLDKGAEPVIMVLKGDEIFNFIAEAKTQNRKIAVYAIGNCILDWS